MDMGHLQPHLLSLDVPDKRYPGYLRPAVHDHNGETELPGLGPGHQLDKMRVTFEHARRLSRSDDITVKLFYFCERHIFTFFQVRFIGQYLRRFRLKGARPR